MIYVRDIMNLNHAHKQPDKAQFIKTMNMEGLNHERTKYWKILSLTSVPKRGSSPGLISGNAKKTVNQYLRGEKKES